MNPVHQTISQIQPTSSASRARATQRLNSLAMPRRALGRLMELAETLAAMAGTAKAHRSLSLQLQRRVNLVMAGDHGVAEEAVSQYPQAVTRAMVETMLRGKASINALAKAADSRVVVVDMGITGDRSWTGRDGFLDRRIAEGTANIAVGPAMTHKQAWRSLEQGIEVAQTLEFDVLGVGEMGIANTTSATAVGCALLNLAPADFTGPGTGLGRDEVQHKVSIIQRAMEANRPNPTNGLEVLSAFGGFEIGGMAGAILAAAALGKPVIIDGLISTSAALIAHSLCPHVTDWMIASHLSTEPLHQKMLEHLQLRPYLDLQLRLGEGTGAALLLPLLDAAAALLTEVATLEEVLP